MTRVRDQRTLLSCEVCTWKSIKPSLRPTAGTIWTWITVSTKPSKACGYTISEFARRTVLDRLLALNHQRHAEEEAEKASQPFSAPAKRGGKRRRDLDKLTLDLL